MSVQQPNYYDILGLPSTATADQIKRRYRELARLYHPDVNPSAEAAKKILRVNQAYHILGDPDRRTVYDADRLLQQANERRARPEPAPAKQPGPQPGPRPAKGAPYGASRDTSRDASKEAPRVFYDGFGRSYTTNDASPRGSRPSPDRRNPAPQQQPTDMSVERLLTEAKLAFINRQFRQAQTLCQNAISINPREAVAHEILGDIFARQGDTERAQMSFAYAIQFNPKSHTAQVKLERLIRITAPQHNASNITYTQVRFAGDLPRPVPDAALGLLTILSGAVAVAAPTIVGLYPGNPYFDITGSFGLTSTFLFGSASTAVAVGILLALYGKMRPFAETLWKRSSDDTSSAFVPLSIILSLFALVWFYASFLVYLGIAVKRNRFSPSVLRIYAAAVGLMLLFAMIYHPAGSNGAAQQVFLFSGNLLFPSLLFGWVLGDSFRLRGRM